MNSIFTKIIKREIPAFIIHEDDLFIAFLDINPIQKGHTLIVPKTEIDYFFDIEDDLLSKMLIFTKKIAKAIKKTIECKKISMSVIGLEVPHAHIHLIPINKMSDANFSNDPIKMSDEDMHKICMVIKTNIS
jgi:histidine triad (HIT) family protein